MEELVNDYYRPRSRGLVVFEYTDWHRSLNTRDKNWRVEYSIERNAQWSLGMATGSLLTLLIHKIGVLPEHIVGIGAREAKQEFGAVRKDAVCRILAAEYPDRFTFTDEFKDSYLFDKLLEQPVPHHCSDAMVVAEVVHRRVKFGEMVE